MGAGNPMDMLSSILPAGLAESLGQLSAGNEEHSARLEESSRNLARIADAVEEIRDAVRSVAQLAPLVMELRDTPFVSGLIAGKSAMSAARKKG